MLPELPCKVRLVHNSHPGSNLTQREVCPLEKKLEMFKLAKQLRAEGVTVTIQPLKKNIKQQIEKLEAEGYTEFMKVYKD